MKKVISAFLVLLLVFVIACKDIAPTEEPIGGDTDDGGCLVGAGYSFDKDIGACTRTWELDSDNKKKAAKLVVAPLSFPVTVTNVEEISDGNYIVTLQRNTNQEEITVEIKDWQVMETAHVITLTPEQCERKGGRTVNIVGGDTCNDNEQYIGEVKGFVSPNICCKEIVVCPEDTKSCPDGRTVGRVPPYCEFESCEPVQE